MQTSGLRDIDLYLRDRRDELVGELCDLLRIPGVAGDDPAVVLRAAEAVAAKAEQAGMRVRVEQTAGSPVVVAHGGDDASPFHLLTYGHYDVFPVDGQSGWRTQPFEPVVEGDRIWARGSGDAKAQVLAHLDAFQWWNQRGGGLPIRVTMIVEGEEEVGSPNLPGFVRLHRDELIADLCVYSDGTMLSGDQPAIIFGCRGALCMDFRATGPRRPLHSGNFGGTVTNPIMRLARLFTEMVAPNGDLLVPGAEIGIAEASEQERGAMRQMAFDAAAFREQTGQDPLPFSFGEGYYERLLFRPSFNVSGIQGGTTDRLRTLVPAEALAKVDLRLVGTQDPDDVQAAIERFIASRGYDDVEVRRILAQPPSRTPIDHPYADLVEEAARRAFGREPARVPSLPGTTPDWVFTRLLGLPTMMLPLGPADQNHHAPNESMKVSLFLGGIRAVVEVIALLEENGRPVE